MISSQYCQLRGLAALLFSTSTLWLLTVSCTQESKPFHPPDNQRLVSGFGSSTDGATNDISSAPDGGQLPLVDLELVFEQLESTRDPNLPPACPDFDLRGDTFAAEQARRAHIGSRIDVDEWFREQWDSPGDQREFERTFKVRSLFEEYFDQIRSDPRLSPFVRQRLAHVGLRFTADPIDREPFYIFCDAGEGQHILVVNTKFTDSLFHVVDAYWFCRYVLAERQYSIDVLASHVWNRRRYLDLLLHRSRTPPSEEMAAILGEMSGVISALSSGHQLSQSELPRWELANDDLAGIERQIVAAFLVLESADPSELEERYRSWSELADGTLEITLKTILLHELGHVLLFHLERSEEGQGVPRRRLEAEAEAFALSNILQATPNIDLLVPYLLFLDMLEWKNGGVGAHHISAEERVVLAERIVGTICADMAQEGCDSKLRTMNLLQREFKDNRWYWRGISGRPQFRRIWRLPATIKLDSGVKEWPGGIEEWAVTDYSLRTLEPRVPRIERSWDCDQEGDYRSCSRVLQ